MKKIIFIVCVLALLLSLGACQKKDAGLYPGPEDITMDVLKEKTTPMGMMSRDGAFEMQWRNDDIPNGGQYASTTVMRYVYDGEYVLVNQIADYDSGDHTLLFFTSDLTDPTLFVETGDGVSVKDLNEREIQDGLYQSMFGLDYYECEITSAKRNGENYQISYDAKADGRLAQKVTMDVDPASGAVLGADLVYFNEQGEEEGRTKATVIYGEDVKIDDSPRTKAIEQGLYDPEAAKAQAEAAVNATANRFIFAAKDMDGNLVSQNSFGDATLIMINFWEPWCQPCVGEMEDLEHLYEDYKDSGLVIMGVLSSNDYDEDARKIIKELGITYPIVHADTNLALYETDSVPTTIFVDAQGNVLTEEPYIGARDYNDWLTIITDLMTASEESEETGE